VGELIAGVGGDSEPERDRYRRDVAGLSAQARDDTTA